MDAHEGAISQSLRNKLARKAFAYTASYDGAIANFLTALPEDAPETGPVTLQPFPETLTLQFREGKTLRYGENPHQAAAFYIDPATPNGPSAARRQGAQGQEPSHT